MDGKERFKIAVLGYFADRGVSPDRVLGIVKRANADIRRAKRQKQATGLGDVVGTAQWLLLGTPPLVGLLGGGMLGSAVNSAEALSPEELKQEELLSELEQQTERLRLLAQYRKAKLKRQQQQQRQWQKTR